MRLAGRCRWTERPKCPAPENKFGAFKLVGRLRLPENLCGFRILVVLRGFYGNARNKACESNEADRYQMIAAPPLMHRKGAMLAPAINSVIKMIMAAASFVRRHAAAATKG